MGVQITTDARIIADDIGFYWMRKRFAAAPAGTRMMRVCWKGNVLVGDTSSQFERNWNHSNLLGLSFDSTVPAYPSAWTTLYRPSRFVGWCTERPHFQTDVMHLSRVRLATISNHSSIITTPSVGGTENGNRAVLMDGVGGVVRTGVSTVGAGTAGPGVLSSTGSLDVRVFPALNRFTTPTASVWGMEIRSDITTKRTTVRYVVAAQASPGAAMFSVFTDAAPLFDCTALATDDVVSDYRPSNAHWVFPRWFMARWSHPTHGMVISSYAYRYYGAGDAQLGGNV